MSPYPGEYDKLTQEEFDEMKKDFQKQINNEFTGFCPTIEDLELRKKKEADLLLKAKIHEWKNDTRT